MIHRGCFTVGVKNLGLNLSPLGLLTSLEVILTILKLDSSENITLSHWSLPQWEWALHQSTLFLHGVSQERLLQRPIATKTSLPKNPLNHPDMKMTQASLLLDCLGREEGKLFSDSNELGPLFLSRLL